MSGSSCEGPLSVGCRSAAGRDANAARMAARVSSSIPWSSENRRGSSTTRRFLRASSIPAASSTSRDDRGSLSLPASTGMMTLNGPVLARSHTVSARCLSRSRSPMAFRCTRTSMLSVWRVDRNSLSGCPPRPGISSGAARPSSGLVAQSPRRRHLLHRTRCRERTPLLFRRGHHGLAISVPVKGPVLAARW
jgi:hypothetical protein